MELLMDENKQRPVSTILVIGIIAVFVLAMCSGCSTVVPVTAKFPEPPGKGAMTVCPDLQKLKDDAKLSDVANTVTINYGTYYECAVKTDAWQEWYRIQKIISDSVK
jgi:hypothetical protein